MTTLPKFYLETDHPVALDSYDYLYPYGAIRDNYRNPKFNQKLYRFPGAILDLGCAGGGFVKNCLDDQRLAVGLEGNDYSQKHKRAEWATIPDYLFICDITKPFTLHTGNEAPHDLTVGVSSPSASSGAKSLRSETPSLSSASLRSGYFAKGDKIPYSFGIVTAWEVLEHILKEDLPMLFANVHRHLSPDGLFIASVTNYPSPNPNYANVDMHRTLQDLTWWLRQLEMHGFIRDESIEQYFGKHWVRNERNSYHLVLRKKRYD